MKVVKVIYEEAKNVPPEKLIVASETDNLSEFIKKGKGYEWR